MNAGKRILLSKLYVADARVWCGKYRTVCGDVPNRMCPSAMHCYRPGGLDMHNVLYMMPRLVHSAPVKAILLPML